MLIWTMKFDRKKAAFWVIMAALVIIGIVLLLGARNRSPSGSGAAKASASAKNEKARIAYLSDCGWTAESPAYKEETVLIPIHFSPVFEEYNALQKEQGFDLSRYGGKEVTLYTYRILDSRFGDNVFASLYVSGGNVIGGDVHSTALDGFMCGLKQK